MYTSSWNFFEQVFIKHSKIKPNKKGKKLCFEYNFKQQQQQKTCDLYIF